MTAIGRNETASRRARRATPFCWCWRAPALAARPARAAAPGPTTRRGAIRRCGLRLRPSSASRAWSRRSATSPRSVRASARPSTSPCSRSRWSPRAASRSTRPDQVRWEMVTPEPLVVDISGSELRAGPPGEVAKIDAGPAVALFRDLAGIFTGAADYAGNRRFTLGPGTSGNSFLLTPRDPSVGRVIASIEIELDPAQRWTAPGGDRGGRRRPHRDRAVRRRDRAQRRAQAGALSRRRVERLASAVLLGVLGVGCTAARKPEPGTACPAGASRPAAAAICGRDGSIRHAARALPCRRRRAPGAARSAEGVLVWRAPGRCASSCSRSPA